MQRMTLDEKVGQLALVQQSKLQGNQAITTYSLGGVLTPDPQPTDNSAWGWYDVVNRFQQQALTSRLGIPIFYGVDAVHGQARAWGTTIFPHNIGLGATNDADLVAKIGQITAEETAAMGINWNYDPVLAVPQDIRWGRTYESFSENTERVTRLGVAKLRGLQMSGLVLGTPKHFTADGGAQWGSSTWVGGGVTARIDRGNATLDEATLRSVHLAPYREAISQGAKSIMVSYSSWNGTKLHAHNYLLNTVLKGELGFSGFVVSDWGGIDFVASNQYDQIVTAINAGIDMVMLPNDYAGFTTNLKTAVARGDVSQNRVDDAVRRILRVKLEMGLFEHPMPNQSGLNKVGSAENRSIARQAVQKSAVLLKNEGNTLPINKNTPLIFVAGDKANDIGKQSGGWTIQWGGVSGNWLKGTTIFGGMTELVKNRGTQLIYEAAGNFPGTATADVCVVAVGENPYAEWRGDDGDLALESAEIALLQKVRPRCKKVVGVLISGRPMIITDQLPLMDALVAAWLPGSEGIGVADLLFGDQPFKGTLPFSWPRSIDQLPFNFALMQQKGCSNALFPYGFGLNVNSNIPAVCG